MDLQSRDAAARVRIVNILAKISPPRRTQSATDFPRARFRPGTSGWRPRRRSMVRPGGCAFQRGAEHMAASEPEGSRAAYGRARRIERDTRRRSSALTSGRLRKIERKLLTALKDNRAWLRAEAAEALRARSDEAAHCRALIGALNDSDPKAQQAAGTQPRTFWKICDAGHADASKMAENDDIPIGARRWWRWPVWARTRARRCLQSSKPRSPLRPIPTNVTRRAAQRRAARDRCRMP